MVEVDNESIKGNFSGIVEQVNTASSSVQKDLEEAKDLSAQNQKEHGTHTHESTIKLLDLKIKEANEILTTTVQSHGKSKRQLEKIQGAYNTKIQEKNQLDQQLKDLIAKETPETKKILERLQGLLSVSIGLKEQKEQFKTNCQNQLTYWTEKKDQVAKLKPEDGGKGEKILELYDESKTKLETLELKLTKRNNFVAKLKRKIDQVPPRREIQQYSRQFIEIFEQLGVKYTETKSYYNVYNALVNMKNALETEIKLLESIQTQYPNVKKSKANKENFNASLKKITSNLDDNLNRAKDALENEKKKRDTLDEKYIGLVAQEREYYRLAKEFQEECNKNEQLQASLKTATAKKKEKNKYLFG